MEPNVRLLRPAHEGAEGELDLTRFQRETRQVTLTPHGRDLTSSARQVVEAAQTYRSHARSLAGGLRN